MRAPLLCLTLITVLPALFAAPFPQAPATTQEVTLQAPPSLPAKADAPVVAVQVEKEATTVEKPQRSLLDRMGIDTTGKKVALGVTAATGVALAGYAASPYDRKGRKGRGMGYDGRYGGGPGSDPAPPIEIKIGETVANDDEIQGWYDRFTDSSRMDNVPNGPEMPDHVLAAPQKPKQAVPIHATPILSRTALEGKSEVDAVPHTLHKAGPLPGAHIIPPSQPSGLKGRVAAIFSADARKGRPNRFDPEGLRKTVSDIHPSHSEQPPVWAPRDLFRNLRSSTSNLPSKPRTSRGVRPEIMEEVSTPRMPTVPEMRRAVSTPNVHAVDDTLPTLTTHLWQHAVSEELKQGEYLQRLWKSPILQHLKPWTTSIHY